MMTISPTSAGPEQIAQYRAAYERKRRLGVFGAPSADTSTSRTFDLHGPSRIAEHAQGSSAYLERKIIRQVEAWPQQPPAVFYDDVVPPPESGVTSATIIADVCRKYRVTIAELRGERRYDRLVKARHEAAIRMTVELQMSSTAVGRRLNRDHTSVLYVLKKFGAEPRVAVALREVEKRKYESRKDLIQRAVAMRSEGKSVMEIMEALPLARSTIERACRARASEQQGGEAAQQ